MTRILLCALAAALLFSPGYAAEAAESDSAVYVELREDGVEGAGERWKLYGASHALVIGIDEYTNGWPRLSNAIEDAESVAAALESQGFQVELLRNPGSAELRDGLRAFFALKGADPEARLFLWYAGHGHTDYGEGYLVPSDAPLPEDPEFLYRALHMGDVGSMVRIARSKHVFAVFDSCFAGTIFNARRARPPAAVTRAVAEPVRQFLTSGDADQEVSDDGTFRDLFLRALSGDEDADANDDGYLTGTELSLYLEDRVINLTGSLQTPRSGKLRDRRFDQGDFIFVLPQPEEPQVAAVAGAAGTRALPAIDRNLAVELAFWDAIKTSESVSDYRAYLTAYPDGQFVPLAEARIAEMEARTARLEAEQARQAEEEERRRAEEEARRQAEEEERRQREAQLAALTQQQPEADPAEEAELALNLNRNDRKELQAALTALGFDTKGVDGFFGPGTRAAIKGYQASKGAEQTGFLTASLASQLIAEAPKPEKEQTAALPRARVEADQDADARIRTLEAEIAALRSTPPEQRDDTGDPAFAHDGTWSGQVTRRSCAANYHGGPIEVRIERGMWTTVSAPLPDFSGPVRDGKAQFSGLTASGHEATMEGTFSGNQFVGRVRFRVYTGMCRLDVSLSRQGTDRGTTGDEKDLATQVATLERELASLKLERQAQAGLQQTTQDAQPAQTQTAAVPPEPAVSESEVESYVSGNGSTVTEQFFRYNNKWRLLILPGDSRPPNKIELGTFRVKEIAGDEIVASVMLKQARGLSRSASFYNPATETLDFLLKWTGSGFEIVGHKDGWEMRRTGG